MVKIANAIAAGASAIIIMNEGDTPARSGLAGFNPATTGDIPVLAATTATGNELRNGVLNGPTGPPSASAWTSCPSSWQTRNVTRRRPDGRTT